MPAPALGAWGVEETQSKAGKGPGLGGWGLSGTPAVLAPRPSATRALVGPPFRFRLPCLRPLPTCRDEAVALGTKKLEPSKEQDGLTSMVSSSLGPLCRWS